MVDEAENCIRSETFWQDVESSVERLRASPADWQQYKDEIASLEGGSMDSMDDEEPYYTSEEIEEIRGRRKRS